MAKIKKRIRNEDESIYGTEPTWEDVVLTQDNYNNLSGNALSWYTQCSKPTEKKTWAIEWGIQNGFVYEHLNSIPDTFLCTAGALARMMLRGFDAHDKHINWLKNTLYVLSEKYHNDYDEPVESPKIMDSRFSAIYTAYDELVDMVVYDGATNWILPEIEQPLNGVQTDIVVSYYVSQLEEIEGVLLGEDEQLVEAYSHVSELVLKRIAHILSDIIAALKQKWLDTKPTRKPRAKKRYTPAELVAKLHYQVEYSNLKSINPEKIIGCNKLITFNTKTRALAIYYADDLEYGIQVKGSTLKNFSDKSGSKIIRNPDVKLPQFINAAIKSADNIFDDIKAVKKNVTGRINKDTILVKVF